MCVAVLIESSAPTLDELTAMEDANPHGAGLAWAHGNSLRYSKAMTAAEIHAALPTLPRPVLLHFRWATHGGKAPHLSHPFPLGPRALTSRTLAGSAQAVLIHNGVWGAWERHLPKRLRRMQHEISDTAVAAYVADTDESVLDGVSWSTAVGRAAGSGRMDVTLRGSWEEHNGNQYSNLYWKLRSARMATPYTTGWDGGWDAGWDGGWDAYPVRQPARTPSHSAYDDADLAEVRKEWDSARACYEASKASKPTPAFDHGYRWSAHGTLVRRGVEQMETPYVPEISKRNCTSCKGPTPGLVICKVCQSFKRK